MDNYQQITEILRKKDFKQALLFALSNSLKIKTKTVLKKNNQQYQITKEIDLINGTKTTFDPKLLTSENAQVISFHQQQVNNIYSTWEKNRETLAKIMQLLAGNAVDFSIAEEKISIDHNSENTQIKQEYIADIPENFDDLEDSFSSTGKENQDFDFDDEGLIEDVSSVNPETTDTEEDNHFDDQENWVDDVVVSDTEEYSSSDNFEMDDDLEFEEEVIISTSENDFNSQGIFEDDEEEIFDSQPVNEDNKVEADGEEEWDDFLGDISNEEDNSAQGNSDINKQNQNSQIDSSPSLEVEEDWKEWLDNDDDNAQEAVAYNPEEIEWNQEDWENSEG